MALSREQCRYQRDYCEENVWHLAGEDAIDQDRAHVLFVTNASKRCALWCQQASEKPEDPVVWDYHVVLIEEADAGAHIYDLDSTLEFPTPLRDYVMKTFLSALALPPEFHPRFRLFEAKWFRESFSSDRSHMKKDDGSWMAEPPSWPAITPEAAKLTLAQALNLADSAGGPVLDLERLITRFSEPSAAEP